jgi:hypothetical protein
MSLRSLFLVALAGLLAAATPINTNASDPKTPPIFAESEPFFAEITVQNPYDRAVKVSEIDATCSCGILDLESYFLLPHATTTLKVSVDDTNRSDRQRLGVSLYLSDPDLEPIEIVALWEVRPHIAVDSLLGATETQERPERAFRDIYRYPSKVRPDELKRLEKRIRLWCPPEEMPEGGLRIEGIDYTGTLWSFEPTTQADGSILLECRGRADAVAPADGEVVEETAVLRTNHPKKPRIELVFTQYIGKDAGQITFDPNALPDPKPPVPGGP